MRLSAFERFLMESIRIGSPDRALNCLRSTPLLQKLHASQPTTGTNPSLQRGLCVLSRLWYPRLSDRTSGVIGKRCAKRAPSLLCWHETRFCQIFYATLGSSVVIPQGRITEPCGRDSPARPTADRSARTGFYVCIQMLYTLAIYSVYIV